MGQLIVWLIDWGFTPYRQYPIHVMAGRFRLHSVQTLWGEFPSGIVFLSEVYSVTFSHLGVWNFDRSHWYFLFEEGVLQCKIVSFSSEYFLLFLSKHLGLLSQSVLFLLDILFYFVVVETWTVYLEILNVSTSNMIFLLIWYTPI